MTNTPLAQSLLAASRRTVEISIQGETVPVTVRRITAGDMIHVGGELITAYGKLGNMARAVPQEDGDGYALTRSVLLAGVVDPPLFSDRSATQLCPEDIPIEEWPRLFKAIADLSDLEGLFRRLWEAAGDTAEAVRPGTAAGRRRRKRRNRPLDGVARVEPR